MARARASLWARLGFRVATRARGILTLRVEM